MIRLWVLKSGGQVQQEQEISSSPECPYCLWGPPRLCSVGVGTLLPMVHEAVPSSPSSTKVRNEWSYTSASLICLLVSTGTLITVVA